ncbi:MAG: peptidylprolyl isomerase [Anaerolineales bacterium]
MKPLRTAAMQLVLLAILAGCGRYLPGLLEPAPTATATEAPVPTNTPVPLAASVNGEPIPLADYERELSRFEAAQLAAGTDLATLGAYRDQVLSAMIDLKLLAQGARSQGASIDPAEIDQRYAGLIQELGDESTFQAWLDAQSFTQEELRASLEEQVLGAKMVAQIVESVPQVLEQVHARHILVASQAEAEDVQAMLASGANFATLANQVSLDISTRPAGGDLGWFPQGYLRLAQVEQAAFSLQPGEISGVVESELGFHIVQTLERGEHLADADVLRWHREQAVTDWLTQQRANAAIEIFTP